ncbi:MAG: hypothetical protein I8H77_04730 [Comamonadaceae bacterium]|nr:hypothetical protein [Comamonadaceae bacterium]
MTIKIEQVSAGRDRSVALDSSGQAWGWGSVKVLGAKLPPGYPSDLCLSNPTEIGHNRYAQPVPQRLNPASLPFALVADGHADTVAVRREGQVLSCRPVVSPENGIQRAPIAGVPASPTQVVQTESATIAMYADGAVWSWGMRVQGQLGRVSEVLVALPARIEALPPIALLAAGHSHVMALDRKGNVWTWGANAAGQLGQGDLLEKALPRKLDLPARIRRIAAGDTHSLAVDEAARLWAWGSNHHGQAGDVNARHLTRPTRVGTRFPVAQINGGMFYTVATSVHGDVFAWGWNGLGQLGPEAPSASARPVRLAGLRRVTQLSAGVGHVLALSDQGVHAWGNNRCSACGDFPSIQVQPRPNLVAFA